MDSSFIKIKEMGRKISQSSVKGAKPVSVEIHSHGGEKQQNALCGSALYRWAGLESKAMGFSHTNIHGA